MKKLILILSFLLYYPCYIYSQSGWFLLSNAPSGGTCLHLIKNSNTVYYTSGNGKIYKSTNGGNNWLTQNSSSSYVLNSIYFYNSSTGMACGGYYGGHQDGVILTTTNGGENWLSDSIGNTSWFYTIVLTSPDTAFAGGSKGIIYKTTNNGSTWMSQNSGDLMSVECFSFINNTTGYSAGGEYMIGCMPKILKTTNGGINWIWLNIIQYPNYGYKSVYFINEFTGYIAGGKCLDYYTGAIRKTTDGGLSWWNVSIGSNTYYSVYAINIDTVLACGYNGVLVRSNNSGSNWNFQLPIGGYESNLFSIKLLNQNTGYAIGNSRLLKTTTGGEVIGITMISTLIPLNNSLFQNYPNPFNPKTIIKFEIKTSADVKLTVLDILGRELLVITDRKLNAGTYESEFDGEDLSSGIYFYRLIVNGILIETKKMLLVK